MKSLSVVFLFGRLPRFHTAYSSKPIFADLTVMLLLLRNAMVNVSFFPSTAPININANFLSDCCSSLKTWVIGAGLMGSTVIEPFSKVKVVTHSRSRIEGSHSAFCAGGPSLFMCAAVATGSIAQVPSSDWTWSPDAEIGARLRMADAQANVMGYFICSFATPSRAPDLLVFWGLNLVDSRCIERN